MDPWIVETEADADPAGLQVLFVCTANRCRSPLAEHLFRRGLQRRVGRGSASEWRFASAGVHVQPGTSVDPLVVRVLAERGIEVGLQTTRQVSAAQLDHADLVLTAGREHRTSLAAMHPGAVRRLMTLRQFARHCEAGRSVTGPVPLTGASLLRLAALGQGRVQPVSADEDLIDDPVGQGIEAFRRCADEIEQCVEQILG